MIYLLSLLCISPPWVTADHCSSLEQMVWKKGQLTHWRQRSQSVAHYIGSKLCMLSGVNTRLVPFILKHCMFLVSVLPHIKHKRLVPYPCTDGSSTMAGGAGPDLSTCCLAPCYLSTRSLTQLLLFKIFHSYLKLCLVRKIQAMLQYLSSIPPLEHFLFSLHILESL